MRAKRNELEKNSLIQQQTKKNLKNKNKIKSWFNTMQNNRNMFYEAHIGNWVEIGRVFKEEPIKLHQPAWQLNSTDTA